MALSSAGLAGPDASDLQIAHATRATWKFSASAGIVAFVAATPFAGSPGDLVTREQRFVTFEPSNTVIRVRPAADETASTGSGVLPVRAPMTVPTSAEEAAPIWLDSTIRNFREVGTLQPGWDTYGALQPDSTVILAALDFLGQNLASETPPPAVVPLPDGGIQIEWHRAGADVEITFAPSARPELYFVDLASGVEWEGPAASGFRRFSLAQRLTDAGR